MCELLPGSRKSVLFPDRALIGFPIVMGCPVTALVDFNVINQRVGKYLSVFVLGQFFPKTEHITFVGETLNGRPTPVADLKKPTMLFKTTVVVIVRPSIGQLPGTKVPGL